MANIAYYYFDASDDAFTDPDSSWTNEANLFDSDFTNSAACANAGSVGDDYVFAGGTNAPASNPFPGEGNITSVKVKIYCTPAGYANIKAAVYTDALGELLGECVSLVYGALRWGIYVELAVPSGGWTWAKLQALEVKVYQTGAGAGSANLVELLVSVSGSGLENKVRSVNVGDGMSRNEGAS